MFFVEKIKVFLVLHIIGSTFLSICFFVGCTLKTLDISFDEKQPPPARTLAFAFNHVYGNI